MDIIPTARQSMSNFASVSNAQSTSSSSTKYGSTLSSTSNDRTSLLREMNQVKAEIQKLHNENGSWAQTQKLETQMSDIQKRLDDFASKQSTQDLSRTEKDNAAEKAEQASANDYKNGNVVAKEGTKTASHYSFIGMFLDVYA